jgi:cytochrome P450
MQPERSNNIPEHVAPERVFYFDMYEDAAIRSDLHAQYARLHREAPAGIFYTPANGGHWMVTGHDLISEVVKDFEHFSSRESQIPRIENPPLMLPLNLDPPEHTLYRGALAPYFGPKSIVAMEEEIRRFAKEIVAGVAQRGECDFIRDVAAPFPVTVFMKMMGMPVERFETFRQCAENFFRAVGMEQIGAASQAIVQEIAALIAARPGGQKVTGQNDLISVLMDAKIGGEPIAQDKLIALLFLLFLGGLDTVTNAMTFTTRYVATDPGLQRRLREDAAALSPFVEESIRLYGVVNTPRLVMKDCERFGVKFKAGEMVLCTLPIVGWDDSKNDDPSKFDIDRKTRTHLTFSTGPHLCVGQFLARMELKALYKEWIEQIGEYSLADGYKAQYRAGMVMSLETLPLKWAPRR